MSGGIDSSYLVYLAKEKLGLRPLVFHVDAGWNSQQAVHNIESVVDCVLCPTFVFYRALGSAKCFFECGTALEKL